LDQRKRRGRARKRQKRRRGERDTKEQREWVKALDPRLRLYKVARKETQKVRIAEKRKRKEMKCREDEFEKGRWGRDGARTISERGKV